MTMTGKRNLLIAAMFFAWSFGTILIIIRPMSGAEIVQLLNGMGLPALIAAGATGAIGIVFGRAANKKAENGTGKAPS